MTKRIEVVTSVERRRRWSREDKERLVAACLEPGANVSEIARSAGCHSSQLFRWRRELCDVSGFGGVAENDAPGRSAHLVPVIVSPPEVGVPAVAKEQALPGRSRRKPSAVVIELGRGKRVRVDSDIDTDALSRILDLLDRR